MSTFKIFSISFYWHTQLCVFLLEHIASLRVRNTVAISRIDNYMHTINSHIASYNAVIFDLHGTLIPWCKNGFRKMLREMVDVLRANEDEFVQVIYEISKQSMTGQFGTIAGEIAYACRVLETDADADSIEQAAQWWSDFHWQGYEKPYPGALSSLQQLRKIGMRTGVITNCGAEAPELFARSQFPPHIDTALFSVTERIQKPDLRMYMRACERLDVVPKECLYVDDSINALNGAKSANMDVLLIRHPGNLAGLDGLDNWTGPTVTDFGSVLNYII